MESCFLVFVSNNSNRFSSKEGISEVDGLYTWLGIKRVGGLLRTQSKVREILLNKVFLVSMMPFLFPLKVPRGLLGIGSGLLRGEELHLFSPCFLRFFFSLPLEQR